MVLNVVLETYMAILHVAPKHGQMGDYVYTQSSTHGQKNARVYHEYRLVETARNAQGKVKQRLVLNLGTGFKLPQQRWKLLANRIKEIMHGQLTLFPTDESLGSQAQAYTKKIIKQRSTQQPIEQSTTGVI